MYNIVVRGEPSHWPGLYVHSRKFCEVWTCGFWATVTSNGLPYATGPISCLSVTLVYCGQMVGWISLPLGTTYSLAIHHLWHWMAYNVLMCR